MLKKILQAEDMRAPEIIRSGPFKIGLYSQKRPGSDGENEDAIGVVLIDKKRAILAVADGAGGYPNGEFASAKTISTLVDYIEKSNVDDYRNVILDAIEAANKLIISEGTHSQTTLTVCEINQRVVRSYQIGDSGMVITGLRGKVKFKTLSQSPLGYAVEAGLMEEDDTLGHPDSHYVSNLLGNPEMKIEMGPPVVLSKYDTLMLASDGIYDNFTAEAMVDVIRKRSMKTVMKRVVSQCQKTDKLIKLDDISCILCRC